MLPAAVSATPRVRRADPPSSKNGKTYTVTGEAAGVDLANPLEPEEIDLRAGVRLHDTIRWRLIECESLQRQLLRPPLPLVTVLASCGNDDKDKAESQVSGHSEPGFRVAEPGARAPCRAPCPTCRASVFPQSDRHRQGHRRREGDGLRHKPTRQDTANSPRASTTQRSGRSSPTPAPTSSPARATPT